MPVKLTATYPKVWRQMMPIGTLVIVRRPAKQPRAATIRTKYGNGAVVQYLAGGYGAHCRAWIRLPTETEKEAIDRDRNRVEAAAASFDRNALDEFRNQLSLDLKQVKSIIVMDGPSKKAG